MFKDLNYLLVRKNYISLVALFISLLVTNIFEYLSLGFIVIYISFLADANLILNYISFTWLEELIYKYDHKDLIIYSSFFLIIIFLFRNLYLALNNYLLRLFTYKITLRNSVFLFKKYLNTSLENHFESDQNKMIKIIDSFIYNSCDRIYNYLILAREFTMIAIISSFIFFYDPLIASATFLSILILSSSFILLVKNKIKNRSIEAQINEIGRVKTITQLFQTMKEIKVYNLEDRILHNYAEKIKVVESHRLFFNVINSIPRLYLEFLAITVILGLSVTLIILENPIEDLIPLLSFIAISATRLIPSFQLISTSLNVLNNTRIAFETVVKELKRFELDLNNNEKNRKKINSNFKFKKLLFKNVEFTYKRNKKFRVTSINLEINRKDKICIVGKSGSGKTTLLSLLVFLIKPKKGQISLNNNQLNDEIVRSYQDLVGYVSQDICLIDDTILNNITLGSNKKIINNTNLKNAIKISKCDEFINNFSNGINTYIGSNGINLSGGQSQRLGLARALYRDPEILFLDEATSALDPKTEEEIIINLAKYFKNKTIIAITHGQKFSKIANKKFKINNGKLTSLSI